MRSAADRLSQPAVDAGPLHRLRSEVESTSQPEPGPERHTYLCDVDIRVTEGDRTALFQTRLTVHHPRGWMGVAAGFEYDVDGHDYPTFAGESGLRPPAGDGRVPAGRAHLGLSPRHREEQIPGEEVVGRPACRRLRSHRGFRPLLERCRALSGEWTETGMWPWASGVADVPAGEYRLWLWVGTEDCCWYSRWMPAATPGLAGCELPVTNTGEDQVIGVDVGRLTPSTSGKLEDQTGCALIE